MFWSGYLNMSDFDKKNPSIVDSRNKVYSEGAKWLDNHGVWNTRWENIESAIYFIEVIKQDEYETDLKSHCTSE